MFVIVVLQDSRYNSQRYTLKAGSVTDEGNHDEVFEVRLLNIHYWVFAQFNKRYPKDMLNFKLKFTIWWGFRTQASVICNVPLLNSVKTK